MMPMIIIIFMLAHQCLRFSLLACCSNCEAPLCRASARASSSLSFWSRSSTFSTFTFMMPTTSLTCACVCCNRLEAAFCWAALPLPFPLLDVGGGGKWGILRWLIIIGRQGVLWLDRTGGRVSCFSFPNVNTRRLVTK